MGVAASVPSPLSSVRLTDSTVVSAAISIISDIFTHQALAGAWQQANCALA